MKQTDKQLFEESFAHLRKLASFILAQRLLPAFNSLEALFFATPLRNRSGLYPPFILSRETIRKVINTAIAQGTSWDEEFEIITEKGNHRWGRVNDDAEIRNGKCLRLYGSFQDIHARKQAENFLKESLLKKIVILESIWNAIFAVDKDWTVTYWNKVAAEKLKKPIE